MRGGSERADDTTMPAGITHFDALDHAEDYMMAGRGRAIGFFSEVDSAEHTLYRRWQSSCSSSRYDPDLARVTIGRGTKGHRLPGARVDR